MIFSEEALLYLITTSSFMYIVSRNTRRRIRALVGMYYGYFWNGWNDHESDRIEALRLNNIRKERFIDEKIRDKQFMAERFGPNARYR